MDRLEMTQAEYARHRGVSRTAVNKYVAAEKIKLEPSQDGSGRMIIDVAAADLALANSQERITLLGGGEPGRRGGSGIGKLTQARTTTETYRARVAELDYEERVGKLLVASDVTAAMRLCAESIARDVDLINSAAPELVAAFRQGGEDGLRVALRKMTRRVLATIAENLRTVATAEVAPGSAPAEDEQHSER
jgi:hypothetical protein